MGLEAILRKYDFDERAYLESLDLAATKDQMVKNLQRSVNSIFRIEKVLSSEVQTENE